MSRGLSFQQLTVALLFGAIAATACLMPAQADTYWHLRAGQEIWRTLHVPLDEHYSFTAAGGPWPNHEWLWQALSYPLHAAGGMPLLAGAAALVVTAAFAIVYRLMVGPTVRRFALTAVALPLIACVWALRPQVVSLLLLAALLALLIHERYRYVPPLFVLWANVHGAVALGGLALAAAAAVAALRARGGEAPDRRRALVLLALLPVSAVATALTPLGFGLWTFIVESIGRSRQTHIHEWLPIYPTEPIGIAFWALAVTFVALVWWRRRALRGAAWADQVAVAVAGVMLPLALRSGRNIAPFLLVALVAASRLSVALQLFQEGDPHRVPKPPRDGLGRAKLGLPHAIGDASSPDHPRANLAIAVAFAALMVAGVGAAWAGPLPRLGWRPMAPGAVAAVRDCPGPLFNRYDDGGFLIWFVPERRVFVDSRQDPYPLPLLLEAIAVGDGAPHQALFARHDIRCAFLPATARLGGRLRAEGWRSSYADAKWTVLVRPGAR